MNMDKALRRVSIAAMLLIVVLMININYVQGSQAESLQKNKLNARQYSDIFTRPRGNILAGNEILAYSKPVGAKNATDTTTVAKNTKYQRFYNDPKIFFPVTGYFASTGLSSGVESAYGDYLNGTSKDMSAQNWFDSFVGKKRVGANVYTTIDPNAQKVAYQQLSTNTQRRGAAVVVDIKTGAIKVAASYPSFDSNTVASTNDGNAANKAFTAEQKKGLNAGNLNRAFNELFPPGSSFKSVVAATALENGYTESTGVPAPFTETIPGTHIQVANDAGGICGSQSSPLIDTFAQSCNTTYALLGQRILGPQKVEDQAEKFGFGSKILYTPGLKDGLKAVASTYPYKEGADKVFLGSFGQGDTQTTPLQMAMVASSIANNGTLMQPYLVQSVKDKDGNDINTTSPSTLGHPISSGTAGDLQDMMKAVVDHGTATVLKGGNIAGKTGTAETSGILRTLWFVGFYPASAPKYAFAVMIEGAKGDFGASKAGPPALRIAQALPK